MRCSIPNVYALTNLSASVFLRSFPQFTRMPYTYISIMDGICTWTCKWQDFIWCGLCHAHNMRKHGFKREQSSDSCKVTNTTAWEHVSQPELFLLIAIVRCKFYFQTGITKCIQPQILSNNSSYQATDVTSVGNQWHSASNDLHNYTTIYVIT